MRRFFSVILCLVLLFSFVVSPITAQASALTFGYILVQDMLVEVTDEFAKFFATTVVGSLPDIELDYDFFRTVLDVSSFFSGNIGAFKHIPSSADEFNDKTLSSDSSESGSSTGHKITLSKDTLLEIAQVFRDSSISAAKQIGNDLLTVANAIVEKTFYVPPQKVWYEAETITYDRLNSTGFMDLVELNSSIEDLHDTVLAGNQINWQVFQKLMALSGYLRTDFIDELDTLFSDLGGSFDLTSEFYSLGQTFSRSLADIKSDLAAWKSHLDVEFSKVISSISSLDTSLGGKLDDMKSSLDEHLMGVNSYLDSVYVILDWFYNDYVSVSDTLGTSIQSLKTSLSGKLDSLGTSIQSLKTSLSGKLDTLVTSIQSLDTSLGGKLDDMNLSLDEHLQAVNGYLDSVYVILDWFYNDYVSVSDTLGTSIRSLNTSLSSKLDSIEYGLTEVKTELQTLSTTLSQYVSTVIPDTITTTKPKVEVAVGSQTILVTDYASANQAFGAKLGWISDLYDFLLDLFDRITQTDQPPKVTLNLSDAEGSYNIGSDVVMIDLSWYSRYKPTGDLLLSGIIWIGFCMHAYRRIPDILSGVGATVRKVKDD